MPLPALLGRTTLAIIVFGVLLQLGGAAETVRSGSLRLPAVAQSPFSASPGGPGADAVPIVVVGPVSGSAPVRVLNGADGTELLRGFPFGAGFTGGLRLAAGDVNGDGASDVVIGTGAGSGLVRVFSTTGVDLGGGYPFGTGFTGAVSVALGDVNGDGRLDVVVGQESGGGQVRIFSGNGYAALGSVTPFGAGFVGGVHVAAGDVNGDGRADLVVGQASGGLVSVVNGADLLPLVSGYPYGVGFPSGIRVGAGDVNGDGRADVILAPGSGGGPVRVFDVATVTEIGSFVPYPSGAPGGVRVAASDLDGDGRADVITAPGAGSPPLVRAVSGADFTLLASVPVFGVGFTGGVAVAAPAPAGLRFTSAAAATFTVGQAGTFVVRTAGATSAPTITHTGTLPAGVTLTDNGDGTATLGGTPSAPGGAFALVLTATSAGASPATQSFVLTVRESPAITSVAATTFSVEAPGTFAVTTTGFPRPALTVSGALPTGVTFADNGDGSATLAGTPAAGSGGSYPLTLSATNGVGTAATQAFVLTVDDAPVFTSAAATAFSVGVAGTFAITTSAAPPVTAITLSGSLPAGVTFTDNGNGTALLAGTPGAGTGGAYPLTFTASNGVGAPAAQGFTLTVTQAPAFTSAAATTFVAGTPGTFTVTTSGFPIPALTAVGVLPPGVTFTDNGDGTATLAGTPAAGGGGTYPVALGAANGVGAPAAQGFTLSVNQSPSLTSANVVTFTAATAGTFTVTATGSPTPTITRSGAALPAAVTFVDNGDGTGTLSGTPALGTGGAYAMTFTAANGIGADAVQPFTLNVQQAPAITSAASDSFVVGAADSFTVTTTGFPAPTLSSTGALPAGVTLAGNVISGTPTETGTFPLQLTAANGVSPDAVQAFSLNVVCPAITVSTASLPDGLFGAAYGPVTFTQTGSTGSVLTWTANGLPSGLVVSSAGIVSGTPTNTLLAAPVAVTVTDQFGCQGSANLTLSVRPNPDADAYSGGVGNTQFVVGAAAPPTPHVFVSDTVLAGDQGPGPLSASLATGPTNGAVVLDANGTFTYTPNPSFAGPSDSFTYTLTDGNGVTNTATVTIGLSNMVWYVNSAGTNGDGRSHLPFNSLANAAGPAAANSTIFVHTGGATTPGGIALDTNQTLWGQGAVFALNSLVIPAGPAPTLTGVVALSGNTLVNSVNMAPAGQALIATGVVQPIAINQVTVAGGTNALALTNVVGAVTVTASSFSNASGAEVLISGGTGPVTVGAIITSNAGRSVDIQNRTGGTVAFTGAITDTAQGLFLNANPGSTIAFSGGLNLSTGTNPAFTATGGGTVTATQNNTTIVNTITTTSGLALNVANTNIGSAGLTFRSISAGTAAPSVGNGIVLDTTGLTAGNGGLTITGAGTAASGGTIQNKTGADGSTAGGIGIYLNNTRNVALNRVRVASHSNFAIRGSGVSGFVLADSTVDGTNGTNPAGGFNEGSITFTELTGAASVSNTAVSGGVADNVRVVNTTGTLDRLTFSSVTFGAPAAGGGGNDAVLIEALGTAVLNVTVQGSTFTSAAGDLFNYVLNGQNTGDLVFTGNTLSNNHPAIATGGGGVTIVTGANVGGGANLTFDISNNTFRDAVGTAVLIVKSTDPGTLSGTFDGNQIGVAGVANSGSLEGSGLRLQNAGLGAVTVAITNNQIAQYNNFGIEVITGGGATAMSGAMNVTVTGNTVSGPGTNPATSGIPKNGLHLNAGTVPADTYQVCLAASGNTLAGSGSNESPGVGTDFRLRQRQSTTVRLPGYAGTNTDNAAVVSFVQANNGGGPTGLASNTVPPGGGFVGGAPCPVP